MDGPAGDLDDVLESGDQSGRRPAGWTIAVLLVLALLAGAGWLVDQRQRRTEFDAVLACANTGQAGLGEAGAKISQISNFVAPALNSGPPAALRAGLDRLIEQTASGTLAPVRQARARCAAQAVRPWHRRIRAARAAYLAYLDARIQQIVAISAAGEESFTAADTLATSLDQARSALLAAAPDGGRARRSVAVLQIGNG